MLGCALFCGRSLENFHEKKCVRNRCAPDRRGDHGLRTDLCGDAQFRDHFTDPQAPGEPGVICQSRGGYLFSAGGTQGNPGAAFRLATDGNYKVMHAFSGSDGQMPAGGLTLGRDGWFYGSTVSGGPGAWGTLYKMRSNGQVTTLHHYSGGNGGNPWAAPIPSVAGDFYGVTHGSFNFGQIYKVSKSGQYTKLHSMVLFEGIYQVAPLVQGTDFAFYGAAIDSSGTGARGTCIESLRPVPSKCFTPLTVPTASIQPAV